MHLCLGLLGKYVPETVLDGPASCLPKVRNEVHGDASRRQMLERDLDTGYVPPEREGSQLPQRHRRKSDAKTEGQRRAVVCHQVSKYLLAHKKLKSFSKGKGANIL